MRSGSVSPTVAIPSVRNTTTPSAPSAGGSPSASVSAPAVLVPPPTSRRRTPSWAARTPLRARVGERELEAVAAASRREAVRRGVGVAEPGSAIELDTEARRGGCTRPRSGRVSQPPRVAYAVEHLRVAERDLPGFPGSDRKHPRAQDSVTRELDQGRVALPAHDLLVDGPRLGGVHRLAPELPVGPPEGGVAE